MNRRSSGQRNAVHCQHLVAVAERPTNPAWAVRPVEPNMLGGHTRRCRTRAEQNQALGAESGLLNQLARRRVRERIAAITGVVGIDQAAGKPQHRCVLGRAELLDQQQCAVVDRDDHHDAQRREPMRIFPAVAIDQL